MKKRISKEELQYIAQLFSQDMIKELGNDPGYEIRYDGKLDSSITQPFQEIAKNKLYPTLVDRATAIYYFCIKNHPFEDGNKRMGIFATILYLAKNGYWLDTTNEELFEITVYTAASDVKEKEKVVKRIKDFISSHLVTLSLKD